jgi:hypothetical protein
MTGTPREILLKAIRKQFAEAVEKAVASARRAYLFNAGSYTAEALADALMVQTMCRWLDDLGEPK